MRIKWPNEALIRLFEIEDFISQDSPERAEKFVDQITEHAQPNKLNMEKIPKIKAVQPIGEERILVTFESGIKKIYDCSSLLFRPRFHLLASPAFFKAVHSE